MTVFQTDAEPPLRILIVEDSSADAELIRRALRGLGPDTQFHMVQQPEAMRLALRDCTPDIVLSDFAMPGFSGLDALAIHQELAPQVPFIFISGTIPEDTAIQALKSGATDYLLKHNLARLQSAVESALSIARERAELDASRQALQRSESRFRSLVEQSSSWIWEADAEGRITYSNDAVQAILGYSPESLHGRAIGSLMRRTDAEAPFDILERAASERKGWREVRVRGIHRDGSVRYLNSSGSLILDDCGQLVGFRGTDTDVTETLQHQHKLRQLGRFHAMLGELGNVILATEDRTELLRAICRIGVERGGFSTASIGVLEPDGTLHLDCAHGNKAINDYLQSLSGLRMPAATDSLEHQRPGVRALLTGQPVVETHTQAIGRQPHHDEILAVGAQCQVSLPVGSPPWGVFSLYSADDRRFSDEEVELLMRLAREIDLGVEYLARNERLERLAYHNPITGLYNRAAFLERASGMLQESSRLATLVGVNNFARINDSRGREYGDAVLRVLAGRLRQEFGDDTLVAHPGEDTFLLLSPCITEVDHCIEMLDRKLEAIERTALSVDADSIYLTLNAGVAVYPDHGDHPAVLYRNADAALSEAERRGIRVHTFTRELLDLAARRIELEHQLREAVANNAFELHYQPRFRTIDRKLVGAEALLRWRGPGGGYESPAEFIPVLEEIGMILPVGEWVMRSAQQTARAWRNNGLAGFRVAVNISARELRNPVFPAQCQDLLGPHVADPLIDVELTESLLMDDIDHSVQLMGQLRAFGCKVAIDDFGTGYSSLNYLARLPADVLKIDQSFTATVATSPETMSLITNIIGLAHSLSLTVVAEGVEDEEQAKLLRLLRCDELQGYLLGRPLPAADFERRYLDPAAA